MKSATTLRLSLLLAAATLPLAEASAQQQPRAAAGASADRSDGRIVVNSWSLEYAVNYSDNFSRIAEEDFERRFIVDDTSFAPLPVFEDGPNGPVLVDVVPLSDTVRLEAVPKTFVTGTFSGTSLFDRPRNRGILTGGVIVGHYLDGKGYADEIEDILNADLPAELDDLPTDNIVPTVGVGNAFRRTWVDPNLSGLTQFDIIGENLYLEAGGFVTEQNLGGQGGILQAAGQEVNEVTYGGFYASPVSFFRLPQQQAIEIRARHSSVFVVDDNIQTFGGQGIRELGDSVSNEAEWGYASGELLPFMRFSLGGSARRFEEDSDDTNFSQQYEQLSGFGGVSYDVTPRLELTARGGYDEAEIESQPATPIATETEPNPEVPALITQDLSGAFYNLGFTWRPSRNTTISAGGGERFRGTQYDARISWQITPRLSFAANANRQISSGAQEIQEQTIRINANSLQLLDRFRSSGNALTDRDLRALSGNGGNLLTGQGGLGIRRVTTANVTLAGRYGRSSWSMRLGASLPEQGESEEEDRIVGLNNTDRYTFELQGSRQVNRRLRVNAQARILGQFIDQPRETDVTNPFFRLRQFNDDVIEQLYGLSAEYRINRSFALTGGYTHQRRSTDQPDELSLFRGTPFEYGENQVRIGARLVF